jgi:hypothetical protein
MSFLAAVIAGLLAWALTSAAGGPGPAVGVAVAVVVYGTAFAAGRLARRHTRAPALPRPAEGSPADVWLGRAEKAVRTLAEQTASATGPVRDQLASVGEGGAETLAELHRIAAHVAAVDDAASRIDVPRLQAERSRLVRDVYDAPSGAERRAQTRCAEAAAGQLAAYGRLRSAREELAERVQTTALGLEGLVARVAEVVALAATTGGVDTAGQRVTELTDQLEGLRSGLAETEAVSRRALGS